MRERRVLDLRASYNEVEAKCSCSSRRGFTREEDGRRGVKWDEERKRMGDVTDVSMVGEVLMESRVPGGKCFSG